MAQTATANATLRADEMKAVQYKMLLISFSAYLTTYFAKNNIKAVTGLILNEFNLEKAQFGVITSTYSFVYIFGQFLAGFLGTRFNAKTVLLIGVLGSLCANFGFGMSSSLTMFTAFWSLNALALSMVWSPLCGILFAWLPEKRWGWWMGILCALSYVGSALAAPTAGFMASGLGMGWRSTFLIMPLIFGLSGLLILIFVKPSPAKAGLSVDWVSSTKEKKTFTVKEYLECLLNSKFLMLCLCYILANAVRWGLDNWIITILNEPASQGGYGVASLTFSSILGSMIHWGAAFLSITTGFFTDKVFKGKKWPVICICFAISGIGCMVLSSGSSILTWPAGMVMLFMILFLVGGLTQAMMSPMSVLPADLFGSEKGLAGNGLLLGVAYIGPIFSGVGLGAIMDSFGNMAAIITLAILCAAGALLSFAIRR